MNAGTFIGVFLLLFVIFSIGVTIGQVFMVREELGGTSAGKISVGELLFP